MLPPELFAWIVAYLYPTVALKLERVCKSWHENLSLNQQIWKKFCAFNLGRDLLPLYDDYKQLALKYAISSRNMGNKKCLVRSIASAYTTDSFDTILHRLSHCGNEVLLTWVENQKFSSSERTFFNNHEIVNLDTWERHTLDLPRDDKEQAILTKNYIVTFPVISNVFRYPVMLVPSSSGDEYNISFVVHSRSDLSEFREYTINVGGLFRCPVHTNMDPDDESLCIEADEIGVFIVDLKSGSVKKFPDIDSSSKDTNLFFYKRTRQIELYGPYLARSYPGSSLALEIIDVRTGSVVFEEKTANFALWKIANNRVLLYCATANGNVRWVLKDFTGKVINEYSSYESDVSPAQLLHFGMTAVINGNFIAILREGNQILFYDATKATNLCVLELDDFYGSSNIKLIAAGVGKFIVSCERDSRLIDFCAQTLMAKRPVPALLISSAGEVRKIPAFTHSILNKAATTLNVPRISLACVFIRHDATERLSLIYAAREFENMSSLEPNTLADRLLAIKISSLASSINMKGYDFGDTDTRIIPPPEKEPGEYSGWVSNVHADVLLVREQFLNGEWVHVPADLTAEQIEDLIQERASY